MKGAGAMNREADVARVVRESQGLLRLAFAYLKSAHDAEDVVQEVFLSYARRPLGFASREHERAWLVRATINRCKNVLKSGWFHSRHPLPDGLPGPDREEGEVLGALLSLDEKYRLPLHLHYYEGYAIKEIAAMLGEKPATIGTRLSRGRALLKERMGGIGGE